MSIICIIFKCSSFRIILFTVYWMVFCGIFKVDSSSLQLRYRRQLPSEEYWLSHLPLAPDWQHIVFIAPPTQSNSTFRLTAKCTMYVISPILIFIKTMRTLLLKKSCHHFNNALVTMSMYVANWNFWVLYHNKYM